MGRRPTRTFIVIAGFSPTEIKPELEKIPECRSLGKIRLEEMAECLSLNAPPLLVLDAPMIPQNRLPRALRHLMPAYKKRPEKVGIPQLIVLCSNICDDFGLPNSIRAWRYQGSAEQASIERESLPVQMARAVLTIHHRDRHSYEGYLERGVPSTYCGSLRRQALRAAELKKAAAGR